MRSLTLSTGLAYRAKQRCPGWLVAESLSPRRVSVPSHSHQSVCSRAEPLYQLEIYQPVRKLYRRPASRYCPLNSAVSNHAQCTESGCVILLFSPALCFSSQALSGLPTSVILSPADARLSPGEKELRARFPDASQQELEGLLTDYESKFSAFNEAHQASG